MVAPFGMVTPPTSQSSFAIRHICAVGVESRSISSTILGTGLDHPALFSIPGVARKKMHTFSECAGGCLVAGEW